MSVEGINGASVTYQGNISTEIKQSEAQLGKEAIGNAKSVTVKQENQNSSDRTAIGTKGTEEQNTKGRKTPDEWKKALEQITKLNPDNIVQFGIHRGTNHLTIKVLDKETKEVIKEFPPEETLDQLAKVLELAGILVDERG